MKNVLITGSEGFIGSNLKTFLEKRGINAVCYDKKIHSSLPNTSGIEAIIHLGANSSTAEKNVTKIVDENFNSSVLFFELAKNLGIKFQYASSASVYGDSKTFKEDEFCCPKNPYALSKYMFDCWVSTQNYPYQGFRYFNVFGSGEEKKGDQASPFTKFKQQASSSGKIKIFKGSDIFYRDFVSVEDVCEIHYLLLDNNYSGVLNIGTGKPTSFLKIAKKISEKYKSSIEIIPMPKELKSGYQKYTCANSEKIQSILPNFKFKNILSEI
jgi:ADP-L-glycero-D-manno-heptose 6-epimerase